MQFALALVIFALIIQLIQCSSKVYPITQGDVANSMVDEFIKRYKFTKRSERECIRQWFDQWSLTGMDTSIESYCYFCLTQIRDIVMDRYNNHFNTSSSIYWQKSVDYNFQLTQQECDDLYWPQLNIQEFESKLGVRDAALYILALRNNGLDGVQTILEQSPGELGVEGIPSIIAAMKSLNISRGHEIVHFLNLAIDWMKAYPQLDRTCTTNSMILNPCLRHLAPVQLYTTPLYYTTCNHLVSLWEHHYAIFVWNHLISLFQKRIQMKSERSLSPYIRLGVIIKKLIIMYNLQGIVDSLYFESRYVSKPRILTMIRTRIIMSLWLRRMDTDSNIPCKWWTRPIDYDLIHDQHHMTVQLYQICCTVREHVLSGIDDRLHGSDNAHRFPRNHPLRSLFEIVNKRAFWAIFVSKKGIDFIHRWKEEYTTSRFPSMANLTVESLQHLATNSNARPLSSSSHRHVHDQEILDSLDRLHIGHQTTSAMNMIHFYMLQIDRTRRSRLAENPTRQMQITYNELRDSFRRLYRGNFSMTPAELRMIVPYIYDKWLGSMPLQWDAILNILYRAMKTYHWTLPDRLELIGVDRSMCGPISDAIYALNLPDRPSSPITLGLIMQALVVLEDTADDRCPEAPLGRVPTRRIMNIVKRSVMNQHHLEQFEKYMTIRCPSLHTEITVFMEVMLALGHFCYREERSLMENIWRNIFQGISIGMSRASGTRKVVIAVMERLNYPGWFVDMCRSELEDRNPTVEEFVSIMNQMIEPVCLTTQQANGASSSSDHA